MKFYLFVVLVHVCILGLVSRPCMAATHSLLFFFLRGFFFGVRPISSHPKSVGVMSKVHSTNSRHLLALLPLLLWLPYYFYYTAQKSISRTFYRTYRKRIILGVAGIIALHFYVGELLPRPLRRLLLYCTAYCIRQYKRFSRPFLPQAVGSKKTSILFLLFLLLPKT